MLAVEIGELEEAATDERPACFHANVILTNVYVCADGNIRRIVV